MSKVTVSKEAVSTGVERGGVDEKVSTSVERGVSTSVEGVERGVSRCRKRSVEVSKEGCRGVERDRFGGQKLTSSSRCRPQNLDLENI